MLWKNTAQLRALQEQKDEAMYNAINFFVKLRKKYMKEYLNIQTHKVIRYKDIYKIDPEQYTKNVADRTKKTQAYL